LPFLPSIAELEQKAQVDLIVVWIQSILGQDCLVRSEDRAERLGFDSRILFGGPDDLV